MTVKRFANCLAVSTSSERWREAFAAVGTVVNDPAGQSCRGGR